MTQDRGLLDFDSTALTATTGADAYRALYAVGAEANIAGPDFRVVMHGWRLDGAVIYDRRLHDVGHTRDARRAGADGLDHFTLTLVVSGGYHIDAGDGFASVAPGEVLLVDTRRATRNRSHNAHIVTMGMARHRMQQACADVDSLHGRILSAGQGFLLADHIASVARHAGMLTPSSQMAIGRVSIDLLAVALNAPTLTDWPGGDRAAVERADRVRAYIADRLSDPGFGPNDLVARFGMSRATLYRDFSEWGGLARYIRSRRLDRMRDLLSQGDRRSIAALAEAAGFEHEARASDAFKAQFGLRPGAYRQMIAAEAPLDRAFRHMREFQDELSPLRR